MADIDKLTREAHLIKMLSTDEGLDIMEAAAIVAHAIRNGYSLSDSIIAVLSSEEEEEDDELTRINEYSEAVKEAFKRLGINFCCKKPQ